MTLDDVTAEDVCAVLYDSKWPRSTRVDAERWMVQAQAHLDAIRELVNEPERVK